MKNIQTTSNGLQGISIGTTALSEVDGEQGRLSICGFDVEELARELTFEDMTLLLLNGDLAPAQQVAAFQSKIARYREDTYARRDRFAEALKLDNPLDSLRACVAMLQEESDFEDTVAKLIGSIPVFIGAWHTSKADQLLPPPVPEQNTAESILHFLGRVADPDTTSALDTYLLTVADHGMNASTFTARVIASTQSDAVSAVTGAIGALKGPLHGGAPGPVLAMLDAISMKHNAAAWIAEHLARGERIMGMGHRIYKVRDPRAAVFERAISAMKPDPIRKKRLDLARTVESEAEAQLRTLKPDRPLKANVEFYTAVLLEACGIPGKLFTAIFAAGRVAGWLAHIKEQRENGRLIRPTVDYAGERRSLVHRGSRLS